MSKDTVDTRVVRMEFDNKQFEKNIKQTSKSLDKLKQDLDFKGVGDSLDKIKVKFSALQIITTTFIVNLTNRLINLGITLAKSLSVDNISSGWTKFGEKTTSVATMMAQKIRIAGKEITDLGEKTKIVNEQLELLTWFADETSYSFTDMVNNVGKFTAAGQDLDTSVKAMEGIATWAAKAGQNSQTASRAMYQLAQAMGKGKIQRIDWMSIQNANMDTEEFRETILATAVALGELTKEGDQFITKTGKKFTQSQFTEFLSEGWFTSDVLIKGLGKYSAAVDKIYEISNREGITASEVMEKYSDQLDEFGMAAFKAAQEARTFVDVLNSVKDAVSSKWMQTFENIFGGQEEAVKLWTELANELYDVFAEAGNFRNDILKVWNTLGGRDDIFGEHGSPNQGAFWNLYDAVIAVRDLIKKAWRTVFPLSQMETASDQVDDIALRLKDLTKRIKDFTANLKMSEQFGQRLSKIFQILFSLLKGGLIVLKSIRFIIDPIIELGKQLVGQVLDQIIYSINKILHVGSGFEAFIIKIRDTIANVLDALDLSSVLDKTFSFIRDIFKIIKDLHPIESLVRFMEDFSKAFEEAGGTSENFRKIIRSVLSLLQLLRKIIVIIAQTIAKYVLPIVDDIIDIVSKLAGFILGTAVKIASLIADLITNINNALQGNGNAESFKDNIFGILEELGKLAKSLVPIIGSLVKITLKLVEVVLLIPKMINELSKRLTGKGIIENLNSLFEGIVNAITNFVNGIKNAESKPGSFSGLFNVLINVIEGVWEVIKGLLSAAQLVLTALAAALKKIGLALQYISNIFIKVFSGRAKELTSGEKKMLGVIAALAILAIIGTGIYNMFWLIISVFKPLSVIADSLTGLMDSLAIKFKMGIFESFANALLKFAVSIVLLSGINVDAMKKSLDVLLIFTVVVGLLAITLTQLTKNVTTLGATIKKVGDTTKAGIHYQNMLMQVARFISAFSTSMIKIAIALAIISNLNSDGLKKGILTLVSTFAMMALLLYAIKTLDKVDIERGVLKEFRKSMLATALTLLVVALAFKQIASLSSDQLRTALLGYLAFMLGVLALLYVINSAKNPQESVEILKSLITVAAVLISLALAIKILAGINTGSLWIAIGAISTIISLFTLALLAMNKNSTKIKITEIKGAFGKYSGIAVMLVALAATLVAMAGSIAMIAFIPWNKLLVPVIAMISLLVAFMTAIKMMLSNDKGSSINKARNIVIVLGSLSLTLFTASLGLMMLSTIPWYKLLASTLSMSVMLLAFTTAIVLINKSINSKKMSDVAKTLLMMGSIVTSIVILAGVLKMLSNIPWQNILVSTASILAMMLGFAAIIYALNKMSESGDAASSIIKISAAFVILSVAMIPLAAALRMFSDIPLIDIGKGFLVIVGSILVLAVAAKVLGAVVPIMAAIAGTLLLIGIATLSAGLGLKAITESMMLMNQDFTPALNNLTTLIGGVISSVIQGLLNTMPQIVETIGVVIGVILEKLTELVPKVIELVATILEGVLNLLDTFGPPLIEVSVKLLNSIITGILDILDTQGGRIINTVVDLLDKLLRSIADHMGSISQSLVDMLKSILSTLANNMGEIVDYLAKMLIGLLEGLTRNIGPIVQALIDFLIELVINLFTKIGPLIDVLVDYVFDFIAKVVVALTRKLVALAGLITKVVLIVLAAVIRLTIASLGALSKLFIAFVTGILLIIAHTVIGLGNVLFEVFKVIIKEILKTIIRVLAWSSKLFQVIGEIAMKMILVGLLRVLLAGVSWIFWLIDFIFGTNIQDQINGWVDGICDSLVDSSLAAVDSLGGGIDEIQKEIKNASDNIQDAVSMTADFANEAVVDGMGAIGDTVTDSIGSLNDALTQFGEDAGENLYTGMADGIDEEKAEAIKAAANANDEIIDTTQEQYDIHSPSRVFAGFGMNLMRGLSVGIQNGASETESAMEDVIRDSLDLATDILDGQDGDDYTIKVGMDISSVEAQTSRIQDIMSGVNNPNVTASGVNAGYNARSLERNNRKGSDTVNNDNSTTVTYHNTFNIESTDPQQSADEIDKVLKNQNTRFKLAHGM